MMALQSKEARNKLRLSLAVTLLMLGLVEGAVRLRYWAQHSYDLRWLITPLRLPGQSPLAEPPTYRVGMATYTTIEPCTERELTMTINAAGGRGPEWTTSKTPGTIRLLVLGASTTFGVSSPDDLTWPAQLERELLARTGRPIEVLNGGIPEARLEQLTDRLRTQWLAYAPDAVLYYEGYNDAGSPFRSVDQSIGSFHAGSWVGRIGSLLHYRSMLYTYLVEKIHMRRMSQDLSMTPRLRVFHDHLTRLIAILREHHVQPIFVLQVMRYPEPPQLRSLSLERESEIEAFRATVRKEAQHRWVDRFPRIRVGDAQLLVEMVRRVGDAEQVPVIDPRPAFVQGETAQLFCDELHLTDTANAILAREVARQLDLSGWSALRQQTRSTRDNL